MSASRRVRREPAAPARWLLDHARAIDATLASLGRRRLGTTLTMLVIAVTLALPAGLDGLRERLAVAAGGVQGSMRASLFLADSVDDASGRALLAQIRQRPGVAAARYLSRDDALAEFRAHSGFGEALDLLTANPLPAVIEVTPDTALPRAQAENLLDALSQLPAVASSRLDREWLERLYAIIAAVQRLVLLIGAALAITVLVVIANTIRLDLAARREEILVLKLIGASPAFIRRPFLYAGFGYGLGGAGLAAVCVLIADLLLAEPLQMLSGVYGMPLAGSLLGIDRAFLLLGGGAGLGWLAALWTVARHLGEIEPD